MAEIIYAAILKIKKMDERAKLSIVHKWIRMVTSREKKNSMTAKLF